MHDPDPTPASPEDPGLTRRFVPDPALARRENLGVAATVALLVPVVLFLLRGERSPVVLFVFGVVGALVGYGMYSLRQAVHGLQEVEITPDLLTVTGRRGPVALRWDEIGSARFATYGGERWIFLRRAGGGLTLFVEGFSSDESAALNRLIRERLDARQVPRA